MSIDTIKKKIEKAEKELKKQEALLNKKLSKIILASGLLEINISEKELKNELEIFSKTLKEKYK